MEKIKATLRVPTLDQYAYIEAEFEGTPREIKQKYDELSDAVKSGNKANHNDFYAYLQAVIDSDLEVWGSVDNYNALSIPQQKVMQSLKRLSKRHVFEDVQTIN